MKSKRIFAIIMVIIIAISSILSVSAASSLLTDDTVKFSVECGKTGYTFEVFQVATLNSTTTNPYETKYTALVPEIANSIKSGNTKAALSELDKLSTMPETATSYGKIDTSTDISKTFNGLPQGIYYIKCMEYPADVTAVENSIVVLPYYTADGWVYEYKKIDLAEKVVQTPPTTKKEITNSTKNNVNYTDVSLGDTVKFKLTNTVTGSKQIRLTTYAVYDEMSSGLTLDKNSFTVYLADSSGKKIEDISKNDYQVNITKEKSGEETDFDVALKADYLKKDNFYNEGVAAVIVEYSAKLNRFAVKGIEGNPNSDVYLEFGNRSGVDSVHGNEVYVYTYGVGVEKLDESSNHLKGAEFALYKTEADATAKKNEIATGSSDDNGNVQFMTGGVEIALQSGNYFIRETSAPEGYNVYAKVIPITIDVTYQDTFVNGTYVSNAPESGYATCTVTDTKVTFPQTGGYVMVLILIGIGLIAGSVFCFILAKASKKQANTATNTNK